MLNTKMSYSGSKMIHVIPWASKVIALCSSKICHFGFVCENMRGLQQQGHPCPMYASLVFYCIVKLKNFTIFSSIHKMFDIRIEQASLYFSLLPFFMMIF